MIRFASWQFLILIPAAAYLFLYAGKKRGLKFSSVKLLRRAGDPRAFRHKIGKFLTAAGVMLMIAALARPQSAIGAGPLKRRGVDIAVLLDVSGSMQSVDFEPNRLEVARKTIDSFIAERRGDRISLIVFAGEAFTRVPLTLDHNVVRESLAAVSLESVNQDGTAIGMAVSVGLNRLKKSEAASKLMILITDGDNNAGAIDPTTAAELAAELGIRVYTIGVGTDRLILPVQTIFGQTQYQQYDGGFDEELLKKIADTTGGRYYRATDPKTLSQIFETINTLEKTEFDDDNFTEYDELAFPIIKAALVLLVAGVFFDKFYFVQIP